MAMGLTLFAAGMVGLSFASVPLYQLFCQVTGYGGTPKIGAAATAKVSNRTITIRFDANTNRDIPWRFKPVANKMVVRLGEPNLAYYRARNKSDENVTGTAMFNVTPFKASPYFSKIDCFCFTEQTLKAGESVDMPVQFFVDPAIYEDPNTKSIKEITLSYTFYRAETDKESGDKAKNGQKTVDSGRQTRSEKLVKG